MSAYDGIATGIRHALASGVDAFFPVVSLLAFLSGCCFGFYYAWRSSQMKPDVQPAKHDEPVRLRKAA